MKSVKYLLLLWLVAMTQMSLAQRRWDGTVATSFASGSGTYYNPYKISNASEFARLLSLSTDANDLSGLYFELTNDIVFNGTVTPGRAFAGTLDGKGHIVHGLRCYNGVFTTLSGTIQNIGFTDKSYAKLGFVSTITETGKLLNSFMEGRLYGTGYDMYDMRYAFAATNKGQIINCYFMGSIEVYSGYGCRGYSYVGYNSGLVANTYSTTTGERIYGFDTKGTTENLTSDVDELNQWVAQHGAMYSTWDENRRQSIFNATRDEVHNVTFSCKGEMTTRLVANGTGIGELPTPTDEDMEFGGWYHGSELVDESYPVYGDMTLEAKWIKEIKVQPTLEEPSIVVSDMENALFQWCKASKECLSIDLAECSTGSYLWMKQTDGSFTSTNDGRPNSATEASTIISVNAGDSLVVKYSISSESGYDCLRITWNETDILNRSGYYVNQTFRYVFPESGTGTLTMGYYKDSSEDEGSDCAIITRCFVNGQAVKIEGETSPTLNMSRVEPDDVVFCQVRYSNDKTVLTSNAINVPSIPSGDTNYLTMDNAEVYAGETVTIPVVLSNTAAINSVGGIITLPEGMEIAKRENGRFDLPLNEERASIDDGFSPGASVQDDGSIKFLIVSTEGIDIAGNDGVLMYMPVTVGESLDGDYTIRLTSVEMADANAHLISCPDVAATIAVEQYTLGDVDKDGQIAPNDITLVIKAYLDGTPNEFCFKAADINGNGYIDPADITAIIKLYLSEGMQASAASPVHTASAGAGASHAATANAASATSTGEDVSLSSCTIEQDSESKIELTMNLTRSDYTSLGGIITLPEGFAFATNDKGKPEVTKNAEVLKYHAVSTNLLSRNQMKFYIGSNSLDLIRKGLSTLISVTIKADEGVELGDFTYTVSALQLSDYDARLYNAPAAEGLIAVRKAQTFSIAKGWSWMSTFLNEPVGVDWLFDNGATRIMSQTQEAILDPKYGVVGNIHTLERGCAYKVLSERAFSMTRFGYPHDLASAPIELKRGWNWIAYPGADCREIESVIANAEEGDVIVAQEGFAEYADGCWDGSIGWLDAGQGYMYKSASDKTLKFDFTASKAQPAPMNSPASAAKAQVDIHKYPNTMNITARLDTGEAGEMDSRECNVYAACGDELRGVGVYSNGLFYTTIYGDKAADITLIVENTAAGELLAAKDTLTFSSGTVGSRKAPYAIAVGSTATGIGSHIGNAESEGGEGGESIYTISGVKTSQATRPGVYIVNGKKVIVGE